MPTYTATLAQRGNSAYTAGPAAQLFRAYSSYTLTAALAINDIVEMLRLPPRARVTGVMLKVTDLDTGGSPAILLTVGDSGDTDRLIASSNIGQAGGVSTTLAATGAFWQNGSTETVVSVYVPTGPATGATTGTIELSVDYVLQ